MTRRRLAVVAVLAALPALYACYWMVAADGLRRGLFVWADDRRAEGWAVAFDEPSVGGFPLRLRTELRNVRLAPPDGWWRWRGPPVRAETRPWRPRIVRLAFPGDHRLALAGRGRPRELRLRFGAARATARFRANGAVAGLSARINRIEADDGIRIGSLRWSFAAPRPGAAPDAGPGPKPSGARLALSASRFEHPGLERREFVLPGRIDRPLPPIDRLDAELALIGDLDIEAAGIGRAAAALAAWRDAGGTIELDRLRVVWPPLTLEADGAFALDGALQPIGAMSARLRGYEEAIDALVEAGRLRASAALAARVVLGQGARRAPDGESSAALPLTLQDRRFSIGPIRLPPLPRIDWR